MKKSSVWWRMLSFLALTVLLIGPMGIGQAAPSAGPVPSAAQQPPPPSSPSTSTQSSSAAAITKLAPDLRPDATSPSEQVHTVSVLMAAGTSVDKFFESVAVSKPLGDLQWANGQVRDKNLIKLASDPGVISVTSLDTYKPVDVPGGEELGMNRPTLDRGAIADAIKSGGKQALGQLLQTLRPAQRPARNLPQGSSPTSPNAPNTVQVLSIHKADLAQAKGYTGQGVVAAVVDTGVDFGHPDLQGVQAHVQSGPYAGWPFAYNTISGFFYATDPTLTIGPDTYWNFVTDTSNIWSWYAHTLPVENPTCGVVTCTAELTIDYGSLAGWPWDPVTLPFTFTNTSQSGNYFYTVHPDVNLYLAGFLMGLGYAGAYQAPAAVLLSDETTAGVYDSVYVDLNFDQRFTDEKAMRKGDELAGTDLFDANDNPGQDGVWDLSASMLSWIADGTNPPPGVGVLYPNINVPDAGRLISFVGDSETHGTHVAGDIAAQGVITDPGGLGTINPLFSGGSLGPVLAGMAPDTKVAAFQNGFYFPNDAWVLNALGFDGAPNTGDEAQLSNNSWGGSATINDGWDPESRFAQFLNLNYAENLAFLVSTGNGGHGYGTDTEPTGGTIIDVGASTSYGSTTNFEFVGPDQFTWGDVQPWSNRGPTTLGDTAPDVVCVGAWGTGSNPLNATWNGEAAYDLFGGTSMAAPICTGNLALVYQAFESAHGRWPTWQEAKDILISGANDLGYDPQVQGAGNVDADRSTDIAAGTNFGYMTTPSEWTAGGYRGADYPGYAHIVMAGDTATQTFTIQNPTTSTIPLVISDTTLMRVDEITLTVNITGGSAGNGFSMPDYLYDVTQIISDTNPDLVRAQAVFPYSVLDPDGDYAYNNRFRVLFYDWTDLNGNGTLWTDTNGDGLVEPGEIDADTGPNGESEYNRFTYGYPVGTWLEASVGKDSLSRRHDGVFFGIQRRTGSDAVTFQVRITLYKKVDWGWLTTSTNNTSAGPGGTATFDASLAVPAGTRPGIYQGEIEVKHGPHHNVIPVVAHVAASGTTFDFGASSLSEPVGDLPLDNGHMFGGFDWSWRYEAGDWRLYYYDVPDGTDRPGRFMVVDTSWVMTPTDIDTWIFGSGQDQYSSGNPSFFGPDTMVQTGGSDDTNAGAGVFLFRTNSGGPREVVGGDVRDGLGFIALHNVLNAGQSLNEPFTGSVYQVEVNPYPVNITTTNIISTSPAAFSGSWTETFSSTRAITEGLSVLSYGLSRPLDLVNEPLPFSADTSNLCDYSTTFDISNGGLIEAVIDSQDIPDIDLYLFKDNVLFGSSTTSTAHESLRIRFPEDGHYELCVDNFSAVPGNFDLQLSKISGNDLVVSGVPSGTIQANEVVTFTVSYTTANPPASNLEGLIFIGPTSAPTAVELPVKVHTVASQGLSGMLETSASYIESNELVTATLTVTNTGAVADNVDINIPIPDLLTYVINSATASTGSPPFYSIVPPNALSWSGTLDPDQAVTITFVMRAGSGTGIAELVATVEGQDSGTTLTLTKEIRINVPFMLYLPLQFHNAPASSGP